MEIKEALEEITRKNKWFAISQDENEQLWLITTAKRIKNGTSKQQTISKFLNKFGYEIKTNVIKAR